MHFPHPNPSNLIVLFFVISFFSCSKDSDLLTDYVAQESLEAKLVSNIFLDDNYIINGNEVIVLDVLSNDIISNPEMVEIIETSQPKNGSVFINENRSLSYVPNKEDSNLEEIVDTFTYTTSTDQEDGTTTTEQATVMVTKISDELLYWKRLFDDKWQETDRADALSKSKSANLEQEYYFLSYYVDGLSSMWQATGDNSYLDNIITIVDNTMADAKPVGDGYLGWISGKGFQLPLWDSFLWRHVTTLLRIMHQSPNLRESGYQAKYDEILAFTEKHIWERYESASLTNFYRSRTHMASHWARIGMELYIITGKSKYKEVFDNISHGTMIGYPSNLRNQFYTNPVNSLALSWDKTWGVAKGSDVQDTSHAGPIVSFMVTAYENGFYWTKEDIDALIYTTDIVWPGSAPDQIKENLDGTGGNENYGRLHEWISLARYSEEFHQKVKKHYGGKHLSFYGSQPLGISALNTKILNDGSPVYPEN